MELDMGELQGFEVDACHESAVLGYLDSASTRRQHFRESIRSQGDL
jgi:hypothetical protein